MSKPIDITGKRFGLLTVISRHGSDKGRSTWLCKCDCGIERVIKGDYIRQGQKSCGCQSHFIPKNKTHGLSRTNTYWVWLNMMHRCYQPQHKQYHRYGGRGISVDEGWHKFEQFYLDMGEKPVGMELDRINNDGIYSKNNCRWTDHITNNLNKSNNRKIIYLGTEMFLSEFIKLSGKPHATVCARLKMGMTPEEVISTPSLKGKKYDSKAR